jgi:hypothetical protein
MTADDDRDVGRQRPHAPHEIDDIVGFERVHGGDADKLRPRRADLRGDRAGKAEIGERDTVTARFERRGDVFHPERLDAEERTETEALVRRHGTQQQNIHPLIPVLT